MARTTARDKHLNEAENLSRDAVFALSNYEPTNAQTIIHILQNAIDEVKAVIRLDSKGGER